jgi:hypothetical protein
MNPANVANDNYGFPASGSSAALPPSGSLSYQLSGPGQSSEMATPRAAFFDVGQFDQQSNVAQINLQRKSPMPSSDELTDKKIEVAEARTDTKIARMEGKLDLVVSKIDGINSRLDDVRHDYRATRANIWAVGLGLAVLIVGVAALFPVFFSVGTQMRDIIDKAIDAHISSTTPVPPRR